jgi:D-alanyl-D-alanine-carboxypeptidase/D-alanyl-D-alanine-endopeptidase
MLKLSHLTLVTILTLAPSASFAQRKASRVDGVWLGSLHAPGQDLGIQFTIKSDASGHEFCSLDSIDQRAFGLECANVALSNDDFSFDAPSVSGHWIGKLSAENPSLVGLSPAIPNNAPIKSQTKTTP